MSDENSNPTDDNPQIDDVEFEHLLQELPSLFAIKRFTPLVTRVSWFAAIGDRPDAHVHDLSRDYLDALGFPEAQLAPVTSWEEASDAAQTLDWASQAWEIEEQLRVGLISEALAHMEEEALQVGLTHIASEASESIRESMEDVSAIWDLEDDALTNAATGAAVQACHNAALVIAAGGEETHPFALKYRLFEAGRWPISLIGSTFNLF